MSRHLVLLLLCMLGPLAGGGAAQPGPTGNPLRDTKQASSKQAGFGPAISEQEQGEIERFFERQAQLFNDRNLAGLMQAFDPDFACEAHSYRLDRSGLETTYRTAFETHGEARIKPFVRRVERLDERYAVAVCQMFSITNQPGEQSDDWCHMYILERRPTGLAILCMFDVDHRKSGMVSNGMGRYDNREFRFRFTRPPDYFLVDQAVEPGYLDNFRLVDPTLTAEIQVTVFPMLLIGPPGNRPQDLVAADDERLANGTDDYQVDQPATKFVTSRGLEGIITETRFSISETSPLAAHIPTPGDYKLARVYLSPDQRIVFALTFQAPADLFDREIGTFRDLAESLDLYQVSTSRYWDQLTAMHGWGEVDQGTVVQHGKLASFSAPAGWIAELLPGAARLQGILVPANSPRIARMEIEVQDQKGSSPVAAIVDAELSECPDSSRLVLDRRHRRLLDCDAVDLTVQMGEGTAQRFVRAVYVRTKDKLVVASLKSCTLATTQKFGPDFERWLGSLQIARN